jgi:hypothetical protein
MGSISGFSPICKAMLDFKLRTPIYASILVTRLGFPNSIQTAPQNMAVGRATIFALHLRGLISRYRVKRAGIWLYPSIQQVTSLDFAHE